jgi:hypothetical protein
MSQEGQQSTLDRTVILCQVQELKLVLEDLKERITKAETKLGVLRAGCEVMFHTLELNGLLAGGEPVKTKPSFEKEAPAIKEDFGKLHWEDKQGEKGPFQQTSEKVNGNCDLWKTLKAKVKEHAGFWQDQGFQFWFDMKNENVVDRRPISKS